MKGRLPFLYDCAALAGRGATILLYHRSISRASRLARTEGTVGGRRAIMRTLTPADLSGLAAMIAGIPEDTLTFFHPHGLDEASLAKIVSRRDIMTYGLFVDDRVCAYAILKLFPTRKAYIGRLVSPELAGHGIGRYLSRFLYWQAHLLGFQACSTIHRDNVASLRSHAAVRPYTIAADLPKGFLLIRFASLPEDAVAPTLETG